MYLKLYLEYSISIRLDTFVDAVLRYFRGENNVKRGFTVCVR